MPDNRMEREVEKSVGEMRNLRENEGRGFRGRAHGVFCPSFSPGIKHCISYRTLNPTGARRCAHRPNGRAEPVTQSNKKKE